MTTTHKRTKEEKDKMENNRRITIRVGRVIKGDLEESSLEAELSVDVPNGVSTEDAFSKIRSEVKKQIEEGKLVEVFG